MPEIGIFGAGFTIGFWLCLFLIFPKFKAMTDAYGEIVKEINQNSQTLLKWIENMGRYVDGKPNN